MMCGWSHRHGHLCDAEKNETARVSWPPPPSPCTSLTSNLCDPLTLISLCPQTRELMPAVRPWHQPSPFREFSFPRCSTATLPSQLYYHSQPVAFTSLPLAHTPDHKEVHESGTTWKNPSDAQAQLLLPSFLIKPVDTLASKNA